MTLEIMARDWIVLFSSLGGTVPRNKHDSIKKFFGQGVEKLNDDCRKIHLYRNPLVGKQMEHVSEYEGASSIKSRIKIHESSAKLPKICTKQPDDEVISGDLVIDEMTAEETRQT